MKEFRVILMAFFTLMAARMMSELPACPAISTPECQYGLLILVLFLLSSYFVDSMLQNVISETNKKSILINFILCLPYLLMVAFAIYLFFTSISVVTVEYILSLNTIYAAVIYGAMYALNSIPVIRRINSIFMVSFIVSLVIFALV